MQPQVGAVLANDPGHPKKGWALAEEGGGEAEEKQGCWEAELTIREGREAGNEERGDK